MKVSNALTNALFVAGLPVLILVAWWLFSADSTSIFWPPLSQILSVFPETWGPRVFTDVVPSLARLAAGYFAAVVLGVALGCAIGAKRALRAFVEPVLEFFRAVPPATLIPALMLFFGIGDAMKIIVIALGCLWPILLNAVEGVRGVDEVIRDTANTFRIRSTRRFFVVTLRAASPQIMTGARQSLSIGIILMVISEMFAASNGIGYAIIQFQRNFAIPQMWSGIILLGVLGISLAFLFALVDARVLAWYRGFRRMEKGGH